MKKAILIILVLVGTAAVFSQQPVDIRKITAPATGPTAPANADSVVQSWQTIAEGGTASAMTGTTSTQVIAGSASNYLYISGCRISNSSLTVSTDISFQDGSGGTIIDNVPAPAGTVATTGTAGAIVTYPTPLKVLTIGNGLFVANVTTGSSTKVYCNGFKSTVSY